MMSPTRWNESEYGNVKDLRFPPNVIWTPDILMYNSASESFDSTFPTNVVVTSEGLCTYIPPGMFKSSCPIDITWFPFDDQSCEMKFGSWTYNGFKVRTCSNVIWRYSNNYLSAARLPACQRGGRHRELHP